MSDRDHPLLQNAYVYPRPSDLKDPDGCTYDWEKGMWMRKEDDGLVPLVLSTDPNRPRPQTKKEDRETGEDQKGA